MASDPDSKHSFKLKTLSRLSDIADRVLVDVCGTKTTPISCATGATRLVSHKLQNKMAYTQHLDSRCILLSDPSTKCAGGPNQNTPRVQLEEGYPSFNQWFLWFSRPIPQGGFEYFSYEFQPGEVYADIILTVVGAGDSVDVFASSVDQEPGPFNYASKASRSQILNQLLGARCVLLRAPSVRWGSHTNQYTFFIMQILQ